MAVLEPQRRAGELHQVLGVALVHDGEVGRKSRGGPELTQQSVADGVKGAAVHTCARGSYEPFSAREHLPRCSAGEGE